MASQWNAHDLIETFTLLPDERQLLSGNEPHNQLGLAVLLKCFQYGSRFPDSAAEVPFEAVEYIAQQLQVDAVLFHAYVWQGGRHKAHKRSIRRWPGLSSMHGAGSGTAEGLADAAPAARCPTA